MNKLKSFFIGIILLAITFAVLFLTVLTYRANSQISVKTYIFQMGDNPRTRVGPLQNVDTMKPEVLRNKLIQKYVAEYFKVIPGQKNASQAMTIAKLSTDAVYAEWLNDEAKRIEEMAQANMFRNVYVAPENIKATDEADWFEVPYALRTWQEPNNMSTTGFDTFGTVLLHIVFEPDFRPKLNVKKFLKQGNNPAMIFKFKVKDIQKM